MCQFTGNLERLVELLSEDPCDYIANKKDSCEGCPYEDLVDDNSTCFERRYADHLNMRGVVAMPVDIGDKVWYIDGGYYNAPYMKPCEIEVTEINKKKSGKTIEWGFIANRTRYKFTSFGKTVFWTEAECAAAIEKKKKSSKKFT